MNYKFQLGMKGFAFKFVVSLMVAIFVMLSFAHVSVAKVQGTMVEVDFQTGEITNPEVIDLTSFFYRNRSSANNYYDDYTFGPGYGYGDGEYYDGYGYGYGFEYFAKEYSRYLWKNGDIRSGFFLGTEEDDFSSVNFSVNRSGFSKMSVDFHLKEKMVEKGKKGAEIHFAKGLEITANPKWGGEMSLEVDSGGRSDVVRVSLETGGHDLAFSDEVIVVVPTIDVEADDLLVTVALSSDPDTQFTIPSCVELGEDYYKGPLFDKDGPRDPNDLLVDPSSNTQFKKLPFDKDDLRDPGYCKSSSKNSFNTNPNGPLIYDDYFRDPNCYNLDSYASNPSTSHCYNFYNDSVYIATRHASDFSAGSDAGTSGGSHSGSVSVPNDEASDDELVLGEIDDFTDMEGIATDDWRYQALAAVFESGLFKGSKNVSGDAVIDLEGGMNRAMAATVLARYLECDIATAPTEKPFSDVDIDMWYAPSVACLKDRGVISGKIHVDPPIYDPAGDVTRAEYLKLFIESYFVKHPTVNTSWILGMLSAPTVFVDVSADDWYAGYFKLAYDNGLIAGYMEDGLRYARGNQSIIRVEAMKIAADFLALGDEQ